MKASELAPLLKKTPFAGLDAEAVEQLSKDFREKRVERGGRVFWEGETEANFFFLVEGRLKVFRLLPTGHAVSLFFLEPGNFLGVVPLLDGKPYPVSVEALKPSRLYFLTHFDFQRFLDGHPAFARRLLAVLAGRLRANFEQMETMAGKNAVEKTARFLLRSLPKGASADDLSELRLPATQEEVAHLLNLAPENFSRALGRLCSAKVIERMENRRYRVLSPEALETLSGFA